MAAEPIAATTEKCPACETVIDTTEADPLARVPCPKCGEKVRVQRSFNNFELVETLGIGGMGTVYKARDTLLDRFVALKLLRKDLAKEADYATRLQQEARVAASVNHPNVIQVFSSGKDHGQFYLVMELVDHGSLDDLIEQKKKLPEELVLEAGVQVAKGLRAAYGKSLIHRDVKPANILFADEHTAKIGDFGLAGVAAETGEARNEIWGTPYYVAPERLYNRPEDFRSDIYSLGATLFHAISGRAPIEGDTNSATALRDLKNRPLNLRTVSPEVSEETARVFQRMIAPEPLKRFGSYDELVGALETAYAKLTGKDLSTRKSRKPLIVIVALLLVALLGLGTWAYLWRQRSSSELSEVAARAERMAALAPLEARAVEAQHDLRPNRFNPAKEAFGRIAADAKNRQPIYDWALLQQGLSAMVGHNMPEAKQAFQGVAKAGRTGFANEDAQLAKFFVATAETLLSPGTVPADAKIDPNTYEAFALFPFALKNIIQMNVADAIPLLERFINTKPGGKFSWIADYKPLAQKYLDDCKLYVTWKKEADEAKDGAAVARHLQNTREIVQRKKFETHTALSEEVYAAEKTLAGQVDQQQKLENASRERVRKEQAQRAAQQVAQKKPQWLSDWKKTLVDDLNRAHFVGEITDAMGAAKYSGIDAATAESLTVKIGPYGSAKIAWIKLAPKTLLAVSTSFIKPNLADAADRQWLCAVYALETGQIDEARKLAEAAAKAKPEYHEQLPLLMAPSQAH